MRRAPWIGCLFWVSLAVMDAWGGTGLFVQGVVNDVNRDSAYATDIAMLRGHPDPDTPNDALDLGNWGGWPWLSVGREGALLHRSILRFPLNSLGGKTLQINRARLILSLVAPAKTAPGVQPLTTPINIELYRIRDANAGWVEGTSNKGDDLPGSVCWAGRSDSAKTWIGGRGCGLAGADYDADPVSSATLNAPDWAGTSKLVFELKDPSLLQNWISHPERNAGFLLRSSTLEALPAEIPMYSIDFFSDDDNPDAKDPKLRSTTLRPRLEIEYEIPATEPLATAPFQAGVSNRGADSGYDMAATSLFSATDGSYGAADELRVGVEASDFISNAWRSLLKFDLRAMHGRAGGVRAAHLTLTVKSVQSTDNTLAAFHILQLNRVSAANAGWREGKRADGGAEAGAATWGWLGQGRDRWAGGQPLGGGLGVAGTDFDGQPVASRLLVPGELKDGDRVAFDIPNSGFLCGWIDFPEENGGFRLTSPTIEEAGQAAPWTLGQVRFYSDDTTQTARRPRLELIYSTAFKPSLADPAWLGLR